jgi:fructuronate reductase
MDGTQKLPQRLLAPAAEALASGGDLRPFAFAIAAWMRWCHARDDGGQPYPLNDPRDAEIAARLAGCTGAADTAAALVGLPGLFPAALQQAEPWRSAVTDCLDVMMHRGMAAAVAAEAQGL